MSSSGEMVEELNILPYREAYKPYKGVCLKLVSQLYSKSIFDPYSRSTLL
jgi:hypothetical protein